MTSQSKRTGLLLLGVCALLLISIGLAWSLAGADYVRRQLLLAVEASTDYRLTINGPFRVSLFPQPAIGASGVWLYRKQQAKPLLQIDRLELKPSIWSLLSGEPRIRHLLIDGVAVQMDGDMDPGQSPGRAFSLPDPASIPILQNLTLRNIRLLGTTDSQAPSVLLDQATLNLSRDESVFLVEAQVRSRERDFSLSGKIGSLPRLFTATDAYPIDLAVGRPEFRLAIDGSIDQPLGKAALNFNAQSESAELSSALALFGIELPPLGRLQASARLAGNIRNAALQSINAQLELPGKLRLEAGGNLQDLTADPQGELKVSGFSKSREVSKWLLPKALAGVDDWQLQGILAVNGGQIGFRGLDARGADSAGLKLRARGDGMFGDPQQPQPFASLDLLLDIDSDNTEAALYLLIEKLPEVGPVQGSARLTAPAGDQFAIEDYQIEVGRKQELYTVYTGRIGHIPAAGDEPTSGIDIHISRTAARTEQLGRVFDVTLPEIGPVAYSGRFVGSEKEGVFNDLSLTAGAEKALQLEVHGQLQMGDARTSEPPKSIDLTVTVASPETAPIAQLTGSALPQLGPVKGRFKLTGRLQNMQVSEIDIAAGQPDTLTLSARGGIEKLLFEPKISFNGVRLDLSAASPSSARFLPLLGLGAANLGSMQARAVLTDADGSLGLEKTAISFSRPELLDIKITGQLDHLNAWDEIAAAMELHAANLGVISDIFGHDWREATGKVNAKGQLHLEAEKITYAGSLNIGRTEIASKISGTLETGRPKLEGTVESEALYLADFGYPQDLEALQEERRTAAAEIKRTQAEKDTRKSPEETGRKLFSTEPLPWDVLHTLDLKLGVTVHEVIGTGATLDALSGEIELESGRLVISPAAFDYREGTLLVDLMLDANDTPRAALKLSADDVAIGEAWGHIQSFIPVSGNINIHLDLSSHGHSQADLAGNLNGVMGVISENLEIPYYTADLLAVDLLGWALKRTLDRNATVLVHCSIVEAGVKQGQIAIQRLMFDGPNMTLIGQGWVNLGTETLDVTLNPERKTGIWTKAEPVRLTGELSDPKVGVTLVNEKTVAVTGATAGIVAGAVAAPMLVLPAVAVGTLWNMITGDEDKGEGSPCLQYQPPTEQAAD